LRGKSKVRSSRDQWEIIGIATEEKEFVDFVRVKQSMGKKAVFVALSVGWVNPGIASEFF
jgi:hypothetical protein